jgi:hypothetical protein
VEFTSADPQIVQASSWLAQLAALKLNIQLVTCGMRWMRDAHVGNVRQAELRIVDGQIVQRARADYSVRLCLCSN